MMSANPFAHGFADFTGSVLHALVPAVGDYDRSITIAPG
jgi:hypothetical protein